MSLDVRSKNARRGTRRTLPAPSRIDDAHASTPCRKFVSDRTADDTGADDDDLHRDDSSW
jgi:hypothetical protein